MSDFDNFDEMADDGKTRCHIPRRCCTCLLLILCLLVLGVAIIASFNLYSNIISRLAVVETDQAQQQNNTVVEVYNRTNNREVELALNNLRTNVTAEFNRLNTDLNTLKTNSSVNFAKKPLL